LQDTLNRGRNACRQLELWLCCQYLTDHIGSLHPGIITQVNAQGLGVRLDDIGVEGFVQLADKEAGIKPAFDARRYSLTHEGWVYRLDEAVNVQVDAVDIDRRRISLSLVDAATAERMRVWQQMDKVE
jgi:exoribonuclease-2